MAGPNDLTGNITLVSNPGDAASDPVFSPDGTKLVYVSNGTIFLKNLTTGAITQIASGSDPVFSPDGSKIAFAAPDTVIPGHAAVSEIFVEDLTSGAVTEVSTGNTFTSAPYDRFGHTITTNKGNGDSISPVFSPDGTKIAFYTRATNFGPPDYAGDSEYGEVVIKDLASGAVTHVFPTNMLGDQPVFSPDGTKIAYETLGTDSSQIVVMDLTTGRQTLVSGVNTVVTSGRNGLQTIVRVAGNGVSLNPVFSPDGSKVAYESLATNLAPGDTNFSEDIYVTDLATGHNTLVSAAADGTATGFSSDPVFSPDGTKIAFVSGADNLVPGDTNAKNDIFVEDLTTGIITRVSTAADGTQADGNSYDPVFSADGTKISFASDADNLVPGDTDGVANIFVRSLFPCYCPGTLIETDRGDIAVENLTIGDLLRTQSGSLRPIKWIGRRSYAGRFIKGDRDILPVCFKAGSLGQNAEGENTPRRDLWVSPHHAMSIDGFLIEAKDLVDDACVVQASSVERVDYIHVELESHDVILAEGAWSETYLDDGNRGMFQNAHDYTAPDGLQKQEPRYCAPRLEDGPELEAVRSRIGSYAPGLAFSRAS